MTTATKKTVKSTKATANTVPVTPLVFSFTTSVPSGTDVMTLRALIDKLVCMLPPELGLTPLISINTDDVVISFSVDAPSIKTVTKFNKWIGKLEEVPAEHLLAMLQGGIANDTPTVDEAPKAEAPKAEAPKAEAPKAEAAAAEVIDYKTAKTQLKAAKKQLKEAAVKRDHDIFQGVLKAIEDNINDVKVDKKVKKPKK